MPHMRILKAGSLAYYDSFSGLIACKIIAISPEHRATIQITGKSKLYRRGEIIETSTLFTPPRDAIKRRRYSCHILPYDVQPKTV